MKKDYQKQRKKTTDIEQVKKFFEEYSVGPEEVNNMLRSIGSAEMKQKMKLDKILARPNVDIELLKTCVEPLRKMCQEIDSETVMSAEIELKYGSYIQKEVELANKMQNLDNVNLRPDFDYSKLQSLSIEARQKLAKINLQL
jgi:tRNA uridine 5-carboxymethylaminomethyl modification enzyme